MFVTCPVLLYFTKKDSGKNSGKTFCQETSKESKSISREKTGIVMNGDEVREMCREAWKKI